MLPVHLDRTRAWAGPGHFGNGPAFPAHDLVESRQPLTAWRSGVPDLAVLKKDARLFAVRPGELHHGRRAAHAFELNDVRELEIAQRAFKFLAGCSRRFQQMLDQIDKVPLGQRFLEKMNRAET